MDRRLNLHVWRQNKDSNLLSTLRHSHKCNKSFTSKSLQIANQTASQRENLEGGKTCNSFLISLCMVSQLTLIANVRPYTVNKIQHVADMRGWDRIRAVNTHPFRVRLGQLSKTLFSHDRHVFFTITFTVLSPLRFRFRWLQLWKTTLLWIVDTPIICLNLFYQKPCKYKVLLWWRV